MRTIPLLLLLSTAVPAEDWDLSKPVASLRAKRMRKEAHALWAEAKPTCDLVLAYERQTSAKEKARPGWRPKKQPKEAEVKLEDIDPQAVAAAVEKLELAALKYERALQAEWNVNANLKLCEVITAWFASQAHLPKPPPPADEKEKKKAESKARAERSKMMGAARKRLMDYGAARRYRSLYHRCSVCDGRKAIRNPLDKKTIACTACRKSGLHVVKQGVVNARWMFNSPFYRADSRRMLEVNRKMRFARHDPRRLVPFVKSIAINGKPEFHGTWIKIHTKEKHHNDPAGRKIVKAEATYVLYRVGKLWYLYHKRYDKQLVDVPDEDAPTDEESGE